MTTTQNKTPKWGGTAFYSSTLKSTKSMACTLGLALATFGTLAAQDAPGGKPDSGAGYYRPGNSQEKAACGREEIELDLVQGCSDNMSLPIRAAAPVTTGNPAATEDYSSWIELYHGSSESPERKGSIALIANANNQEEAGFINFVTYKGDSEWTENMRISAQGNVGIGQQWPSDKLVVNGTVRGTNFRLDPNGDWSWGGFGGPGFGLSRGGDYANAPNFSGQQLSAGTRPVLLQGLNGVGIATQNARFALNANGTSCIGLTEQEVLPIANLTGSAANEYKLYVKKGIRAERVKVDLQSTWADYVFAKDYQLPSLTEVQQHIDTKGHLPGVPSGCEVESEGIDLAEMAKLQMQKIEELTLYILQQEARIKALEAKVADKE